MSVPMRVSAAEVGVAVAPAEVEPLKAASSEDRFTAMSQDIVEQVEQFRENELAMQDQLCGELPVSVAAGYTHSRL